MSDNAPRTADGLRFGPIDALILIASVLAGIGASLTDPKDLESALGLGSTQAEFEKEKDWTIIRQVERPGQAVVEQVSVLDRFRWKHRVLVAVGQVFLPVVTLGAGLAIFRHRAARSRRFLRHVGVLTTAVAAIFVAFLLLYEFRLRWIDSLKPTPTWPRPAYFDSIWWDIGQDTGLAIATLWVVLALGRRWCAAPNWADRVGRVIGAAWIASTVAALLLMYVLLAQ